MYYDINAPIAYNWPYPWQHMPSSHPIVNPLLKAIIECNMTDINYCMQQGATMEAIDDATLGRVLYHIIDNYPVMRWLVEHGLSSLDWVRQPWSYKVRDCIEPGGFMWCFQGAAWSCQAYSVMEMLAQNGFGPGSCCTNGQAVNLMEWIFQYDDIRAIRIFIENGYPRYGFSYLNPRNRFNYLSLYPNSKVTRYLLAHPVIRRRTFFLDPCLFTTIPAPELTQVRLFHRKIDKEYNRAVVSDHRDRLRAQKEFINYYGGQAKWEETKKQKQKFKDDFFKVLHKIVNE